MKKILFFIFAALVFMFAALAFVACEKEENSPLSDNTLSNGSFPPKMFTLTPDVFNAEAGTVIFVKTPMPTYNVDYFNNKKESYPTGIKKIPATYPAIYENDYYSLVQTACDTYEITIKPIDKTCIFGLVFRDEPSNNDRIKLGYITVNYTSAE